MRRSPVRGLLFSTLYWTTVLVSVTGASVAVADHGVTTSFLSVTFVDNRGAATETIEQPSVTDSGNVAALVRSTTQPAHRVIAWEPLSQRIVTGRGQPLTGGEAAGFIGDFELNDRGDLAFQAVALESPTQRIGFYLSGESGIVPIAFEGEAAPGAPGGVFERGIVPGNGDWQLNNVGQVVFNGWLDPDASPLVNFDNDEGIWLHENGVTRLLVREGDPMPVSGDVPLDSIGDPSINDRGQVAFYGALDTSAPRVDNSNSLGIWLTFPGSDEPELIARSGDPAPGEGGARFVLSTSLGAIGPALSDTGLLAFPAGLTTGTQTSGSVWASDPSGLRLVSRSGEPAPGVPGAVLASPLDVQINDEGDVLIVSTLDDGSPGFLPTGFFTTARGDLSYIAAPGQPAPGLPGGAFQQLFHPEMNNRGDVVFKALATDDPSDGDATVEGVWAYIAALDEVIPVAIGGQDLLGLGRFNPGPIAAIELPHDIEFRGTALSESGEVVATVGFTGGVNGVVNSALVRFTLPVIPEPSTAALLLAASLAVAGRRRG